MDRIRILHFVLVAVLASACTCFGDMPTDDEIRRGIVRFLTPRCGGGNVDDNDPPDPGLADFVVINGDTNRLARILAEIAQTNNAWYSEMAMWELERYGTSEQLPFFYSCATNPVLGKIAVESVLRIEGVNSNSLDVARSYLCQTNQFPVANIGDRAHLCRNILEKVFSSSSLTCYRSHALGVVEDFQVGFNTTPNGVDIAIISAVPDYRYSKRRLAVLRTVKQRLDDAAQYMAPTNHEAALQVDVYNFQTNYLANAINELVAYPEANLPD